MFAPHARTQMRQLGPHLTRSVSAISLRSRSGGGSGFVPPVWTVLLAPPVLDPDVWLLLALGAGAGAVATAFRRGLRFGTSYAVGMAALLVSGPAVSCIAGGLCAMTMRLRPLQPRRGRVLSHGAFRASRETLALAVAAAGYVSLDGFAGSSEILLPMLAHAVIYAAVRAGMVDDPKPLLLVR